MSKANEDIRQEIKDAGVTQWEIAEVLGVHESVLCRKMRKELNQFAKSEIRHAIVFLRREREQA